MDILISSNLERLLYLLSGGDDKLVAGYMKELSDTGCYQVSEEMRKKIQSVFVGGFCGEAETEATIGKMMDEHKLSHRHPHRCGVPRTGAVPEGNRRPDPHAWWHPPPAPSSSATAVLDALSVTDKATGTGPAGSARPEVTGDACASAPWRP